MNTPQVSKKQTINFLTPLTLTLACTLVCTNHNPVEAASLTTANGVSYQTVALGNNTFISRSTSTKGVKFNFQHGAIKTFADKKLVEGFLDAGANWSQYLLDDVSLNINISYGTFDFSSAIAAAHPSMGRVNYLDVLNQLEIDKTSVSDKLMLEKDGNKYKHLSVVDQGAIGRLINLTQEQNGQQHFDSSIDEIWLTRANAKALGIIAGNNTNLDGQITLSSSVLWEYGNNNDSLINNLLSLVEFDLVSTATHEIGHLLGFISGTDILDLQSQNKQKSKDTDLNYIATMDLLRNSTDSANYQDGENNKVIDWTVSDRDKYFSLDGGKTKIASFAKGESIDGYQGSHWKEGQQLGIMDPRLNTWNIKKISNIDLQLFDAIGWDVAKRSATNYTGTAANYTVDPYGFSGNLRYASSGSTSSGYRYWAVVDKEQVPEPSSIFGFLGLGIFGFSSLSKSKCSRK